MYLGRHRFFWYQSWPSPWKRYLSVISVFLFFFCFWQQHISLWTFSFLFQESNSIPLLAKPQWWCFTLRHTEIFASIKSFEVKKRKITGSFFFARLADHILFTYRSFSFIVLHTQKWKAFNNENMGLQVILKVCDYSPSWQPNSLSQHFFGPDTSQQRGTCDSHF